MHKLAINCIRQLAIGWGPHPDVQPILCWGWARRFHSVATAAVRVGGASAMFWSSEKRNGAVYPRINIWWIWSVLFFHPFLTRDFFLCFSDQTMTWCTWYRWLKPSQTLVVQGSPPDFFHKALVISPWSALVASPVRRFPSRKNQDFQPFLMAEPKHFFEGWKTSEDWIFREYYSNMCRCCKPPFQVAILQWRAVYYCTRQYL